MKKILILLAAVVAAGLQCRSFAASIGRGNNFCHTNTATGVSAPKKERRNIILMITDGTSLPVVSAARWLQYYRDTTLKRLNLDPYLCGTVRTVCSDSPIGDSAPTTSCYVTGHSSRAGFVSTYPPSRGRADLEPIDTTRAYTPMASILEAGRILKGKALGMVFTCQFCHATPADCSAHYYDRNASQLLADQTVHNGFSVVIGGGNRYLSARDEQYLADHGYTVHRNDLQGLRADLSPRMWALFGDVDMDYDIDRDSAAQPSLAEMTRIAIDKLSGQREGFFLMVEGSKVDWAAHDNDPAALPTDFLAFDKAVGVALDFARKDGNTTVIIVPDHGNSGFSIGRADLRGYSSASVEKLFGQLNTYRRSGEAMARIINAAPNDSLLPLFRRYENLALSEEEVLAINNCKDYSQSPIPEAERRAQKDSRLYSSSLDGTIRKILTAHTYFGWTTGGHTGEDVFLAVYDPEDYRPTGMNTNVELARYIQSLWGMEGKMDAFTARIFAPHKAVFADYVCSIEKSGVPGRWPVLTVTNPRSRRTLKVEANTNIICLSNGDNGETKQIELPSVITYVDRNDMFYLPADLARYLK